jgi:hypothetical protein
MLTGGTTPFEQCNVQETLKKIVGGEYEIPERIQISSAAQSFLADILHVVSCLVLIILSQPYF